MYGWLVIAFMVGFAVGWLGCMAAIFWPTRRYSCRLHDAIASQDADTRTIATLRAQLTASEAAREQARLALGEAIFLVEGLIVSIEEQYDPGSRCYDERAIVQRWRTLLTPGAAAPNAG